MRNYVHCTEFAATIQLMEVLRFENGFWLGEQATSKYLAKLQHVTSQTVQTQVCVIMTSATYLG